MALLGDVTLAATGSSRFHMSPHHLLAACKFANSVREVEVAHAGAPFGEFWEDILHHSLAVATSTVASLEGYANELYLRDAGTLAPPLNEATADRLTELVDRSSALEKYSTVLIVRAGRALDFGRPPVQDVDLLVRLRNAVVHFGPEWFHKQERHNKLSNQLAGRFPTSNFLNQEPIFPRAWATYGFCLWAIGSVGSFINETYRDAGLEPPVEKYRDRMNALAGTMVI